MPVDARTLWESIVAFWKEVGRPIVTSGPAVVLILIIAFRKRCAELLKNISSLEWEGKVVRFRASDVDGAKLEALPLPSMWRKSIEDRRSSSRTRRQGDSPTPEGTRGFSLAEVEWHKSANLFWLGHDLMWTQQAALRGAEKETLAHGLNHCCYHCWELRLEKSHPGRHLDQLEADIAQLPDGKLDREWRKSFAQGMNNLIFDLASIAMAHQPDYEWDVVPKQSLGD